MPSASPSAGARAAVIAQYDAFWRALPRASAADTDKTRLAVLLPVTTDPELSQLVRTLGEQRASGEVLYGENHPRPRVASVRDGRAAVADCQDSSSAGVKDVKSGRKLTVGVARHAVNAILLKRGGTWKVSEVHYAPNGSKC